MTDFSVFNTRVTACFVGPDTISTVQSIDKQIEECRRTITKEEAKMRTLQEKRALMMDQVQAAVTALANEAHKLSEKTGEVDEKDSKWFIKDVTVKDDNTTNLVDVQIRNASDALDVLAQLNHWFSWACRGVEPCVFRIETGYTPEQINDILSQEFPAGTFESFPKKVYDNWFIARFETFHLMRYNVAFVALEKNNTSIIDRCREMFSDAWYDESLSMLRIHTSNDAKKLNAILQREFPAGTFKRMPKEKI